MVPCDTSVTALFHLFSKEDVNLPCGQRRITFFKTGKPTLPKANLFPNLGLMIKLEKRKRLTVPLLLDQYVTWIWMPSQISPEPYPPW